MGVPSAEADVLMMRGPRFMLELFEFNGHAHQSIKKRNTHLGIQHVRVAHQPGSGRQYTLPAMMSDPDGALVCMAAAGEAAAPYRLLKSGAARDLADFYSGLLKASFRSVQSGASPKRYIVADVLEIESSCRTQQAILRQFDDLGFSHVAFETANISESAAHAIALGATAMSDVYVSEGVSIVYCRDPDNTVIEFIQLR